MSPKHSIDYCPICGGGLCGIRICGVGAEDSEARFAKTGSDAPHGLVICDQCEAIWLEPDLTTAHQYPSIEGSRCPICSEQLWGKASRWADLKDIETLGWEHAVSPDLDVTADQGNA